MGAYKYYNPSTQQWEIIKSKSIIKPDGSLEYTPDDIQEIENNVNNLKEQKEQIENNVNNLKEQLDKAQYTPEIYNSARVFSMGQGYDKEGNAVDYSASVVNGQINDISIKGLTATNLVKNGDFRNGIDDFVFMGSFPGLNRELKDGCLYFESNTNNQARIKYGLELNTDDIYYFKAIIKASKPNIVYLILGNNKTSQRNATTGWEAISVRRTKYNWNQIDIVLDKSPSSDETHSVYVKYIMVVNLTQVFGAGNEPDKEECDNIFSNCFEGTKSTFGAIRLKSVGKNLFDGKILKDKYYSMNNGTTTLTRVGNMASISFIKVKPNTNYVAKFSNKVIKTIHLYNSNHGYIRYIYSNASGDYVTFTTPANCEYIRFDCEFVDNVQIEEGTVATPYEPYKESVAYITAKDESGNILELRSLPNGTKDEINIAERKLIKRIEVKSNITSGTIINFTDMAEGGTYYAWNDNGETETGTKGDTLGIDAITLIYQLAQPIEIPIEVFGSLQSYENGTVYIDTIISKVNFYDGQEGIQVTVPIKVIDTLYKVDKETGYLHPLDISQVVIAEDGLSFTHPDLQDGDLVDIDYVPDIETTRGAFSFTLPTNLKASINSALEGIKDLYKQTYNLNIRVTANRQEINNDFNKHKENVDDYIGHLIKNRLLGNKTKYIAHRGASRIAPENTLPAYEKAGELGFWGAECDVLVSADGVWVLHHDDTVDRMTDGTGNVSDFTLAQLKSLTIDAGNNIAYYPNLKIPTLEEYLLICKKWGIVPVIEIKPATYTNTHYDIFVDLLKKMNLESKAIVISFNQNVLTEIRNRSKYIQLQLVSSSFSNDLIDFAKALGNTMLDLKYNIITQSIIEECHTNDIMVNTWTVNDYNIAKTLRNYGVDFITTDFIVD